MINDDVPAGNGAQTPASARQAALLHLGRNELLNRLLHRERERRMAG